MWTSNKKVAIERFKNKRYPYGKLLAIDKKTYLPYLFFAVEPFFKTNEEKNAFIRKIAECDEFFTPKVFFTNEYWLDSVKTDDVKIVEKKGS